MIKHNILVYAGPGTCAISVKDSINTIKKLVNQSYEVIPIGPNSIHDPSWQKYTNLLVMPGGAAGFYMKYLSGIGNYNIKKYVEQGGKYLGICAGAYYAADRVEFAKGDAEFEVIADRELKFYPGLSSGPMYSGFGHRNARLYDGVRATKIICNDPFLLKNTQTFRAFYNGGGSFPLAENFSNVKVLAHYCSDFLDNNSPGPAAIVECVVGEGRAILSGVHLEWDPLTQYKQTKMKNVQLELQAENENRLDLMHEILNKFGLFCRM